MAKMQAPEDSKPQDRYDVIVVGAGFAGLYMLHRLRSAGFRVIVFEAGGDVGGTWYWNRYPGARCDVESLQYSYSFSEDLQQEWRWTERFATQPEILSYLGHVADRFDLRRDIVFETRVVGASFDDAEMIWRIETDQGASFAAPYCVMATGCLSESRLPDIPGIGDYRGKIFHTGRWPHEDVDFSGQKVGVIGTGSSGIQIIPHIARQAERLVVFQRTPNFSVPARNARLDADFVSRWKADYPTYRLKARETRSGTLYEYGTQSAMEVAEDERHREFERRWRLGGANFLHAYNDILRHEASNKTAADFVRSKIAAIVTDPKTAAALAPGDHPIGAKRICVDTDYFETFNRDNVTLVDLRETPIESVTPHGIRAGTTEYVLDSIILATGFDAITGALLAMDIRGAGGIPLREEWNAGPCTYLGLMIAGFPNLFIITGPGSPSVLSNMVLSIEHHVDWITNCLLMLRKRGGVSIAAASAAQDSWMDHVDEVAGATLYSKANSWYLGANIPGKPRRFMPYIGGVGTYRAKCDEITVNGYEGFIIDGGA